MGPSKGFGWFPWVDIRQLGVDASILEGSGDFASSLEMGLYIL